MNRMSVTDYCCCWWCYSAILALVSSDHRGLLDSVLFRQAVKNLGLGVGQTLLVGRKWPTKNWIPAHGDVQIFLTVRPFIKLCVSQNCSICIKRYSLQSQKLVVRIGIFTQLHVLRSVEHVSTIFTYCIYLQLGKIQPSGKVKGKVVPVLT